MTARWRRTSFTRLDGTVDAVPDDWVLMLDGQPAARIYRLQGGPQDGRWFWSVLIDAQRRPYNSGTGVAANGAAAKGVCEGIIAGLGL